jgi:hypothetical protein
MSLDDVDAVLRHCYAPRPDITFVDKVADWQGLVNKPGNFSARDGALIRKADHILGILFFCIDEKEGITR